jgi:dihydropteroate synthase
MLFRARQFEFVFPRPALVMGIVNVTPDSFSDGGNFFDSGKAVNTRWNLSRKARKFWTSAANPRGPAPRR